MLSTYGRHGASDEPILLLFSVVLCVLGGLCVRKRIAKGSRHGRRRVPR